MEEKIYSVTLLDGTVLNNLKLNGNNYISQTAINPEVFVGNLSVVTINDGEKDEVHQNMELVRLYEWEGAWWFILRDVTDAEMAAAKVRSDIEYLAMMSNVEL